MECRSSPDSRFDIPSPPLTSEERRRFSAFTLPKLRERSRAFTLMEMLTVIGIISILLVLLVPAFTTRKSADDVTSAANGIKGLLETARTYAKANNTYVFVGLVEVKASVTSSGPQQAANGRVAVAAVASKDGTRNWTATNLTPIGKLQVYENLHFAGLNFGPWTATLHLNSNMARSQLGSGASYNLGTSPNSVTPFDWPLGSPLNSGKYRFKKVINFDPQGVARIAYSTNSDEVTNVMEIDFQQSHGTAVPAAPPIQDVGNQFVIQIDAPTGAVRLYRP